MATGYCTLDDVRRALRKAGLPGDIGQDTQIAVDAITAQTEWLEKKTRRHWYVTGGISEDDEDIIPTDPRTRDDEEDIPTPSAFIADQPLEPKTWHSSYTKIRLARRDVEAINELLVRSSDGSYVDWVADSNFTGGTWPSAVGDDYYLRVNNGGWSDLYLDMDNLWDADNEVWVLDTFAKAVYVTFDYGHQTLPQTVRRAVAFRAGSDLVEDAVTGIPENVTLYDVETKAEQMERKAEELLDVYMAGDE